MPLPPVAPLKLTPDIVIRKSCAVDARTYLLPSREGTAKANDETIPVFPRAAVTISGSNLVVDFHGATLEGTDASVDPDHRKGLGIRVVGSYITLRNARVRGYRVGLLAEHCPGLKLIDCDFSYNWKQHLKSTVAKEDESDWQSYHHNEKGEWFRYGAGMYLADCDRFEVKGARVHGGQCGLMLTRCNHGKVWNSDFSFDSGLGLGIYRSSDNRVMHNRMDWDVRGFSYGVYNRGQDSAGILCFEQSNRNVFAYNSVTHGGDGFFLWAGQQTMDTGEGGCNGNLLFANDFSHSPCNGIEATFSANSFVANLMLECWHGIWGGYSHDSKVVGNYFGYNAGSIAIEHGRDNVISLNRFDSESAGIDIWQDPITDKNWAYPKHRDTASHSYVIRGNQFLDIPAACIALRNTTDVVIDENSFQTDTIGTWLRTSSHVVGGENKFNTVAQPVKTDHQGSGDMMDVDPDLFFAGTDVPNAPTMTSGGRPIVRSSVSVADYLARFSVAGPTLFSKLIRNVRVKGAGAYDSLLSPPLKDGMVAYLAPDALRGQRYILVDEWGPYDFQRPLLVPRGVDPSNPGRRLFEILGPAGRWRVVGSSGVSGLSSKSGAVPGELAVSASGPVKIELEYVGGATTDEKGVTTAAGTRVRFWYRS